MKESTRLALVKTVMLWELMDENLSTIDDRDLQKRMKYLFNKVNNNSRLLRTQLERAGVINHDEDDYERVKEQLIETVINQVNTINYGN